MFKRPVLTKVPGDPTRGNETEKQGYIKSIERLSKTELLDLKARQEMLLHNRSRLSKLPDKGAKIQRFYDQIVSQLKVHDDIDQAAKQFSKLNIVSVGKKSLTQMEWKGDRSNNNEDTSYDSDDDVDPMKILARAYTTEKKIIIQKPEKPLITEADLADIESMKNERSGTTTAEHSGIENQKHISNLEELDGHSKFICEIEAAKSTKNKFLPFRTTKSEVHNIEKEKQRYLSHQNVWENTAATPPSILHSPAKLLPLEESIRIQTECLKVLEESKKLHAEERLKRREEIVEKVKESVLNDVMPGSSEFTTYRELSDSEQSASEDHNSDSASDIND